MNETVEAQIKRSPYEWNHIQYVLLSCWTPRSVTMQTNNTLVGRNFFTSFTHESRQQALSKFSQCLFCQLISLATIPTTTFPKIANIGRKRKEKKNENEKFNVYSYNKSLKLLVILVLMNCEYLPLDVPTHKLHTQSVIIHRL